MKTDLDEQSDIAVDMAPLIDCVFLLLIFFLVATTLKKIDRELPVELPDAATAIETKLDPATLVLGIDRQGALYLDSQPIGIERLHQVLQAAARQESKPLVRIDGDRSASYQSILHLIDQCRFYGLETVNFHLRRGDSEQ